MTTQAYGTTYHYQAPDGQRREIGVIRGLGDTWIVGWSAGGAHHRVKTPRLPAGTDPAALQALIDTWAGERGLPTATPADAAPAPAAPAPAAAERQQSEAVTAIPALSALPAVPDGWQAKADLVDQCVAAGQRLTLWIAVIVAQAREDFSTPGEWISACTERWGWEKAHVHHMHAVGSLLIRECSGGTLTRECSGGTLPVLIDLHWQKLLAISRLPADQVARFIERERPQDRTRDDVRAAVNRWLAAGGEPPADAAPAATDPAAPPPAPVPAAGPAVQQDFLDTLFAAALDDASRRAMASDATPARKTAVGGLVLIDVAVQKWSGQDDPDLHDMETLLADLGGQETRLREVIERTLRRAGPPPAAPVLLQPADHQEF